MVKFASNIFRKKSDHQVEQEKKLGIEKKKASPIHFANNVTKGELKLRKGLFLKSLTLSTNFSSKNICWVSRFKK